MKDVRIRVKTEKSLTANRSGQWRYRTGDYRLGAEIQDDKIKEEKMRKNRKVAKYFVSLFAMLIFCVLPYFKAEAGSIYSSPYVELAPDGQAWTTCPGETHNHEYSKGYTVDTGVESTLRALQAGEHYYKYDRTGDIPVGEWVVEWDNAACIHILELDEYHDLTFGDVMCGSFYTQGWFAYCADCHERIAKILVYMCEDAAKSITSIPMGMDYYYLCPHCTHLEQGAEVGKHECEKISWNQYKVVYKMNTTMQLLGGSVMYPTYHMYNNMTEYEGDPVTPDTRLAKMKATVFGYEFVGWNTKPDGSGTWYADEQEIYNLTEYDWNYDTRGTITLYAQWKKSESTLLIDSAGGSYLGNSGITSYTKQAYDNQVLYPEAIVAPPGAILSFQTNGGEAVADMQATGHFDRWEASEPFGGRLVDNVYYFLGKNGTVDRLTAVYMPDAITLPDVQKENSSFGGWYYDEECKKPAGAPGDKITIDKDTTLYAHWVELELDSKENYSANNRKGAADLWWSQPDLYQKAYRIYRYASTEKNDIPGGDADWTLINSTLDETVTLTANENLSYSGASKTYMVPYTGIYKLTAAGAQGGNYGSYKGGLGGKAEGTFWLNAGDVITYTIGGQNGYNGGGSASAFGNGGGATVISSAEQGILLVAAGGGGATGNRDGGAGGVTAPGSLVTSGSVGESGAAGGGGGSLGGKAGAFHQHTDSCYTNTVSKAGTVFYNARSAILTNAGNGYTEVSSNKTHFEFWPGNSELGHTKYSMQIGNTTTYFSTPGNGELSFNFFSQANGSTGVAYPQRDIYVYSNTGALVSHINLSALASTVTSKDIDCSCDSLICTECTRNYSRSQNGYYTGTDIWNDDAGHDCEDTGGWVSAGGANFVGNGTVYISIPEDVEGIYIVITESKEAGDNSAWFIGEISNVTYSYKTTNCGLDEVSSPSYGGSSYINTAFCNSYSYSHGSITGNGYFTVQSENIGFVNELKADGVPAPDLAAPDAVSGKTVTINPAELNDNRNVAVSWETPEDNGTDYYFKVESHKVLTGVKLCTSNIRMHTMTTGVKGYYYLINTSFGTDVTAANAMYTAENHLQVTLTNAVQYLHLAPVDVAGNMGATTTVKLGSVSGSDAPPDTVIPWPIYTEQLNIKEADGVYPAPEENTFYVRCDDATPIELSFSAYMEGVATSKYQITHSIFESQPDGVGTAQNIIVTPLHDVVAGEIVTSGSGLNIDTEGASVLSPYLYNVTTRSNSNRDLAVVSQFLIGEEADGKTIRVTPTAGVVTAECSVYSDSTRDLSNSLYLIGDATAPTIQGAELLEDELLIDREAGEVILNLQASDALSGLAGFRVDVYNEDNGGYKNYTADESGEITLDLTGESTLFAGDFTITMSAIDNVGNVCVEIYHVTELALETKVERILAPHEPIFKRGESGILTIETWGHVDKVEVEFPESLREYDETYDYIRTRYKTEESIQFMIPLYGMEDGDYDIKVRVYKGEKTLEDILTIFVSGTILDELRTRLR